MTLGGGGGAASTGCKPVVPGVEVAVASGASLPKHDATAYNWWGGRRVEGEGEVEEKRVALKVACRLARLVERSREIA